MKYVPGALAALALSVPVFAQPGADREVVESAVILGSHASSSLTGLSRFPAALDRSELQLFGRRSTEQAAAGLLASARPIPGMDSFVHNGAEQSSPLNLFGLGSGRTLVMVDGRRLGATPIQIPGWRDAAASPSDLSSSVLSGIQVLPGGASLYGSGAVGGVVNLVTREPFTGFELGFVNTDIAEADTVQQTDLTFGVGGGTANFMLSWEESSQPALEVTDRQWAMDFQDQYPKFSVSTGNGSPGRLTFQGQQIDLYLRPDVTSCEETVVMEPDPDNPGEMRPVMEPDPDNMGQMRTVINRVLCGDEEVVFDGFRPLTDLLPAGQTSLAVPDLFCEQLRGEIGGDGADCLHRYGDDLILQQRQEEERIFMAYTHELSPGTEMRVQYSYNLNELPLVRGIAQRTPLNPRWQQWQVPVDSSADIFLLAFSITPFNQSNQSVVGAQGLQDKLSGFQDSYLPDASFFLDNVQICADVQTCTAEQVALAQEQMARASEVATGLQDRWAREQADDFDPESEGSRIFVTIPSWDLLLRGYSPDASLTYNGNVLGGLGKSVFGSRNYRRHRYVWDLQGQIGVSGVFYRSGVVLERSRSTVVERDLLVQNFDRAVRGYGSPSCPYAIAVENDAQRDAGAEVPASVSGAGRGGCFYVTPLGGGLVLWDDPTTSLISGVANRELLNGSAFGNFMQSWLFGEHVIAREQQNVQMDFVLEGGNDSRTLAWATGAEYRHNYFALSPFGLADAASGVCDLLTTIAPGDEMVADDPRRSQLTADSCLAPVGPFAHLPSVYERKARRDVLSLYGDLHLRIGALDLQTSARLETDNLGASQLAPALSLRWQVSPSFTLAASAEQSFRFPSLIQRVDLDHRAGWADGFNDYLLVQSAPASEDLSAETGFGLNLGIHWASEHWSMGLRYWDHQIDNPIVQDSLQLLVDAFSAGEPEVIQALEPALLDPLACAGVDPCPLSTRLGGGLRLNYRNGAGISASGFSLQGGYTVPTAAGTFGLGLDVHLLQQYQVDDLFYNGHLLSAAFDAAGQFNFAHPFGSLPEMRTILQFDWRLDLHHLRLLSRYTSPYKDQRNGDFEIAAWNKLDLQYSYELPSRKIRLSMDVSNLQDEDPPRALVPLGYDGAQHDPHGRTIKLGITLTYP